MAQRTLRTVAQVLNWIETNRHHIADGTQANRLRLRGYENEARIPDDVWRATRGLVKPGGFFDCRMYRATWKGRLILLWAKIRREKL